MTGTDGRDQKLGSDPDLCWWWEPGLVVRQRNAEHRESPGEGGATFLGLWRKAKAGEDAEKRMPPSG